VTVDERPNQGRLHHGRAEREGSIKIGVKFDQPGLGNLNPSTDEPEGFDVEIGKIVAGKLGIDAGKIEWIETVSANRETAIENGTVDLVIATYTINDERKERLDFAGPYYVAGQDLLVAADDDTIKGPEDLAGKKVCAASGSTPIENIRENYPDAELWSSTRTPSASTSSWTGHRCGQHRRCHPRRIRRRAPAMKASSRSSADVQ
jgi:ABC-type amino acid transport substrate-binding protein